MSEVHLGMWPMSEGGSGLEEAASERIVGVSYSLCLRGS